MVKKYLTGVILIAIFLPVSFLFSEEKSKDNFKEWLNKMQTRVQRLQKKSSSTTFTTVAGVRGAKQETGKTKLYWKGKKGTKVVSAKELTLFQTGLDYAQNGEYEKALSTLEKLVKTYPKSALLPDAQKTIALIKEKQKTEGGS